MQNADFLTKGLPQETFQANRHRVQGWTASPNQQIVRRDASEPNGKPSSCPTRERESQDSPQVIHKAVLTQFTALDGKTDRSSAPNRLGLQSPQFPAKNFSQPMAPHCGNTEDHPNLSMATWSVPGTTENQLEPNDLDDHERGTSDQVE